MGRYTANVLLLRTLLEKILCFLLMIMTSLSSTMWHVMRYSCVCHSGLNSNTEVKVSLTIAVLQLASIKHPSSPKLLIVLSQSIVFPIFLFISRLSISFKCWTILFVYLVICIIWATLYSFNIWLFWSVHVFTYNACTDVDT